MAGGRGWLCDPEILAARRAVGLGGVLVDGFSDRLRWEVARATQQLNDRHPAIRAAVFRAYGSCAAPTVFSYVLQEYERRAVDAAAAVAAARGHALCAFTFDGFLLYKLGVQTADIVPRMESAMRSATRIPFLRMKCGPVSSTA